jgi:hypothetical protein
LFESCCTRAHHPQLHLSKEPRLKLSPHPLHIEVQPYMHGPNSPALDDHPDHRQMQQACISLRRFDDSLAEMPYLQTCHRAVSFMACLQPFMLHAHPGGGGGVVPQPTRQNDNRVAQIASCTCCASVLWCRRRGRWPSVARIQCRGDLLLLY